MDTKPFCPSCGKPLSPDAPKGLCPECLMRGAFPTGTETGGKSPRFVPPKIEELAAHFPGLEILEFIGQGGMGAVYKARQKQLDRLVALKILPSQAADGPGFAERFTREARALAKLNHPHIVTLYEFGQTDGLFYFLMEFVDGVNLRQLLNASRMAPQEALAIVPQICDALQFAHERGIVHRDIKPENILLSRGGQVKIADFGIAKIVAQGDQASAGKSSPVPESELTGAGNILGTPQYMAPEQVAHPMEVDHRADIYSLGVVFYQMLTGELPAGKFEAPSKKVVIDVRLDEVVLRALEKKPERRYQQASQVSRELETIAGTPPDESSSLREPLLHFAGFLQFQSPVALNFARAASLGFLGFLGCLGFIAGWQHLFALTGFFGLFGFLGVAYIIEMVSRPGNSRPQDASQIKASVPLFFASLSGILGAAAYCIMPRTLPVLDALIVATALLGIILGIRARRRWLGKSAIVVGSINLAISLITAFFSQPIKSDYIGRTDFPRGDSIEITSVERMADQLTVKGHYRLVSAAGAHLDLYITTMGTNSVMSKTDREQSMDILRGEGSFELTARHLYPGLPHVTMYSIPIADAPGRPFAEVYFGTQQEAEQSKKLNLKLDHAFDDSTTAGQSSIAKSPYDAETPTPAGQTNESALQLVQAGWQLWNVRKLEEAAVKFQQAVNLAPNDSDAWNGLGWADFNSGKTAEGEAAFQKAVALKPNQPAALNGLGQIYLSRRKYEAAEKYLLQAAPEAPAAWYGLARLYLLQGNFEQARRWAQNIIDSGQAHDSTVEKMLQAAKDKHLSEGLRLAIAPPAS